MEHEVTIYRTWETARSVISEVWIDGEFFCFGLEPPRISPLVPPHPCIPAGTYHVVQTHSPHLGYVTPEVLDVPGRSEIRWHIGNGPRDVIGCMAVGKTRAEDFVGSSEDTFTRLMAKLPASDLVSATYIDGPRQIGLIDNGEPQGTTAERQPGEGNLPQGNAEPGNLALQH